MSFVTECKNLYAYRDLIRNLVRKDTKVRYLGFVGILWSLINPAVTILIYLFVFTYIFHPFQERHALYLVTGVIHWNLFAQTINLSSAFVTSNANLLTKIYFPRVVLVMSGIAVNFSLWILTFFVFLLFYKPLQGDWDVVQLTYPFFLILFLAFIFGLSLVFSVLNVAFKDVNNAIRLATQVFFWATPIIYPVSRLPGPLSDWIMLSPFADFILIFESLFFYNEFPSWQLVGMAMFWTVLVLVIGIRVFYRKVPYMIEKL